MDARTIADLIDEMALDAQQEIAVEMADDLRQIVGTPYPPASVEGEPPHLRTGGLQNSVYDEVEQFVDSSPRARVGFNFSQCEYAQYVLKTRPAIPALKYIWTPEHYAERMQAAMDSYARSQQRW